MKNLIAIAMALGCAVGCGGGDDDTLIKDATVEQAREVCEYSNDQAPTQDVTCGSDTIPADLFQIDCSMISGENTVPDGCTATIQDAKDCIAAQFDDVCAVIAGDDPPECAELNSPACEEPDEALVRQARDLRDRLRGSSRI